MEAPRPLPRCRRLRVVDLARGLCVGALSLALLGPAAAPAGAAAGPGVLFSLPGGGTPSIPATELEASAPGLREAEYLVRAAPGEAGESFTRRGMPVEVALEKLGIESFGFLTIPRPGGTTAYLPATYFREPSPFEGGKSAVFSVDHGSTRFLRPLLAGEPNDVNAEDNIATVSGEALTVGVHDGDVLAVQATASANSTAAGSAVQFTATATGGLPGEEFTYHWAFGDGTTGEGEAMSHGFGGSGTFEVRVTATGSADSGGESGPVEVVVGDPPTAAHPGATSAPQPKPKRKKPARSAGTGGREGRGSKGAKSPRGDGGRADSASTPAQRHKDSGSSSDSSEPVAPATTTPEPVTPTPAQEEPTRPTPKGGGRPDSEGPVDHVAPRSSAAATETVEGRLVGDDLSPTTVEDASGGAPSAQSPRSAAGAVGGGGAAVPVVALMVVGLLAGGALIEWRRGRPIR